MNRKYFTPHIEKQVSAIFQTLKTIMKSVQQINKSIPLTAYKNKTKQKHLLPKVTSLLKFYYGHTTQS